MPSRKNMLPQMHTRAAFEPSSLNEKERTIDLVWTTGAKVRRSQFFGESYFEELALGAEFVRMGRLESGRAPYLKDHGGWSGASVDDVIGVITKASISPTEGRATIRFSERAEVEPIWKDVKAGILGNCSVGYVVHKYERIAPVGDEKLPTYRAIDWEPMEVSQVAIGADGSAMIRSNGGRETECELINKDAECTGEEDRTMPNPVINTPAKPAEVVQDLDQVKREAAKEARDSERKRADEIKKLCRSVKLDEKFSDKLIVEGVEIDAARAQIIDELAKTDAAVVTRSQVSVVAGELDESVTRREAMVTAIAHRGHGDKVEMTEAARDFRHMSLMDMARSMIRNKGVNVDRLSKSEICTRAFGTSDFPNILLDAANKSLLLGYKEAPNTFESFVSRVSFSDFKTHNRVALGDAPVLEEVKEGGPLKEGTMADRKEAYALVTYAKKTAITRQTIINDDLGALTKIPQSWGMRSRQKEADLVYNQITSNPTMGDSVALFHLASHSNLQVTAALAAAALGIMRAAMRKQVSIDSARIDVRPVSLLVPVALETTAEDMVNKLYVPTKGSDQSAWLRTLSVIAEPRLDAASATAFYLLASKDQCDLIELASLEGSGPMIETKEGWDTLGAEMRIVYDVAAKVLDYRGFQKNLGQ